MFDVRLLKGRPAIKKRKSFYYQPKWFRTPALAMGFNGLKIRYAILFLMILKLLQPFSSVLAETNHYIVMFDASGSMKTDFARTDNFWKANKIDLKNANMAEKMYTLVKKTLLDPPAGIPEIKNNDYFSFLLFRLEWNTPSYELSRMFISNKRLLLRNGPPASPQEFMMWSYETNDGLRSRVQLRKVFGGHSPIVAATTAVLPYLGQSLPLTDRVERIFIIRITDGTYNASGNSSDEYAVISRTIKVNSLKKPEGFSDYRRIAYHVNRNFDIGANINDCFLKTKGPFDPLRSDLVCRDDAFAEISEPGLGFLVTYLEVKPIGPPIHSLVQIEKRELILQQEYRDGKIQYFDRNEVRAASSQDGSVYPLAVELSLDNKDRFNCVLEDGAVSSCGCGIDDIICQKGNELRIYQSNGYLPNSMAYHFRYEQSFNKQVNNKQSKLYPFTCELDEIPLNVDIQLSPETLQPHYYYPAIGSRRENNLLAALNPKRLIRLAPPVFEAHKITEDVLAEAASWAEYKDRPSLTAALLAEDSRIAREEAVSREKRYNDLAKFIYAIITAISFICFIIWPRRTMSAEGSNFAESGVLLNFNRRDHEHHTLIGMIRILNVARTIRQTAFKLNIEIDNLLFKHGQDELEPDLLKYKNPLISIEKPNQSSIFNDKVKSGKLYPLFFDTRKIADCGLPASKEAQEINFFLQVKVSEKRNRRPQLLNYHSSLYLYPELGRLELTPEDKRIRYDKKTEREVVNIEYQKEETAGEICAYVLRNASKHSFSLPMTGKLRIRMHSLVGDKPESLEGAINFQLFSDTPKSEIEYHLKYGQRLPIKVVADFTRLGYPVNVDTYYVTIEKSDSNGGEEETWKTESRWHLLVNRSSKRTEISMRVIDNYQKESRILNESQLQLPEPINIGCRKNSIDLSIANGGLANKTRLFELRLANLCKNGPGFALWNCKIKIASEPEGFFCPPTALYIADADGRPVTNGQLLDSPLERESVTNLSVELDNSELDFLQADLKLNLVIVVDWEIHEEGDSKPPNHRSFTTEVRVNCTLKHRPPLHALAFDIGTSAVAIAHATASNRVELLPLQAHLVDNYQKDQDLYQLDDDKNTESPFLCSECNVLLDPNTLKDTTPKSGDFLELPLRKTAVELEPDKVFLSLKALVSIGLSVLPLPADEYPYKNSDGRLETKKEPPLLEVIHGAYEGLKNRYVEPILTAQKRQGFSHLFVTHPNTYSPNHVRKLRRVVAEVFQGYSKGPNVLWPQNIKFFSESEAVAYYYLAHCFDLCEKNWSNIPLHEKILIYDIGAGTLDLTYLEVKRSEKSDGGKTPREIWIRRQSGVNRAGNLLDECIARDLHEHLGKELDNERYTNPIVSEQSKIMSNNEVYNMELLRRQIHNLKSDLANGNNLSVKVTQPGMKDPILKHSGAETDTLYRDCQNIIVTDELAICWEPEPNQVLKGRYVEAFLKRVTETEIYNFFSNDIPTLDTVVVSGRTSLLPGFLERLKKTLVNDIQWVNFSRRAVDLKKVVPFGVMERLYRYRDIKVHRPEVIGDFGVEYENRPYHWCFEAFKSGETKIISLDDATEVRIGLRTSSDSDPPIFEKKLPVFSLTANELYGTDRKLHITLTFNRKGYLKAEVKNSDGRVFALSESTDIATLEYRGRPWPLGGSKLKKAKPDEVVV